MRYAEYLPDPRLRHFIKCYWVFECDAPREGAPEERVVPDGHPELVFHFGDAFSAARVDIGGNAVLERQPVSLFAGQITGPLMLRANGRAGILSVRFQPWGARRLLGLPMFEATNAWIATDDLPGHWLDGVGDAIAAGRTDLQRVAAIESALLKRAARVALEPDAMLSTCVVALHALRDQPLLPDLGRLSGLSARQLERRFNDAIGVSPKLLGSILRFRALFDALNEAAGDVSHAPWLDAAIATGYFDQAHMIRDFRRFAGQPPQAFYRSLSGLSAAMVTGEVD